METVNHALFAPVFFFFSIVLFAVTALSLLAFFKTSASFGVVACIAFVFAYNSWCFAKKLKESR
jgi:hypothetical protein